MKEKDKESMIIYSRRSPTRDRVGDVSEGYGRDVKKEKKKEERKDES